MILVFGHVLFDVPSFWDLLLQLLVSLPGAVIHLHTTCILDLREPVMAGFTRPMKRRVTSRAARGVQDATFNTRRVSEE
jgi:hypothetical protein